MHYKVNEGDVILPERLLREIPDLRLKVDDMLTWYNKGDRLYHFIAGHADSKLEKHGCGCQTKKKPGTRKASTKSKT